MQDVKTGASGMSKGVIFHHHCTGSFTNIVPAPFNYQ